MGEVRLQGCGLQPLKLPVPVQQAYQPLAQESAALGHSRPGGASSQAGAPAQLGDVPSLDDQQMLDPPELVALAAVLERMIEGWQGVSRPTSGSKTGATAGLYDEFFSV